MEKEVATNGPMTKFTVSIDPKVHAKIMHWVHKASGECSGLGKVDIQGGDFRVIDACLLKQENGAASTEIDASAITKAMFEMRLSPGHLNFWWHSHVEMGVFWSGTDLDTIREIGKNGFVVSSVFNKKNEVKSAVYIKPSEILPECFFDDLPTHFISQVTKEDREAWDKEFEEKCKSISYRGGLWPEKNYAQEAEDYYGSQYNWESKGWEYGTKWGKSWKNRSDDAPAIIDRTRAHVSDSYAELEALETHTAEATQETRDDAEMSLNLLMNVEQLVLDMEVEQDMKEAREMLNDALRGVDKSSHLHPDEKAMLKQEYIQRFNVSRKAFKEIRSGAQ